MKTFAVTDLDAYLWTRDTPEERGGGDWERLKGQLLRTEPPTEALELGRAFHDACAHFAAASAFRPGDDVLIGSPLTARFHIHALDDLPPPPLELPLEFELATMEGETVVARGRIDALEAGVHDYKTTSSAFDAEKYLGAYQWRLYLLGTGLERFVWHVFTVKQPRGSDTYHCTREKLEMFAYPEMAEDVRRAVTEFVAYVDEHVPAYWSRRLSQ